MGESLSWRPTGDKGLQPVSTEATIARILKHRGDYGITRVGSITGLDWIGIPVCQVIRPRSLSVVVSQGKGLTSEQAMITGLMETLEGWASERIEREQVFKGTFAEFDPSGLWAHLGTAKDLTIEWIAGVDLLSGRTTQVPVGLVDTNYAFVSPHPSSMPRDSTGLAAGTNIESAIIHGGLECLERHARSRAMTMPHFFDRFQIDLRSIHSGTAAEVVGRLSRAGFLVGIWRLPAAHDLPAYWCHIMEDGSRAPFAPLPGEGFSCRMTHDEALTAALLEACQSRLAVISAAREDIGAGLYRFRQDKELADWRRQLASGGCEIVPSNVSTPPKSVESVTRALELEGASAVVVVELHSDESIPLHVVRVVTPPLTTNPERSDG